MGHQSKGIWKRVGDTILTTRLEHTSNPSLKRVRNVSKCTWRDLTPPSLILAFIVFSNWQPIVSVAIGLHFEESISLAFKLNV